MTVAPGGGAGGNARLTDLCPEDKQRVGKLIATVAEERQAREAAERQSAKLHEQLKQERADSEAIKTKLRKSLKLLAAYQQHCERRAGEKTEKIGGAGQSSASSRRGGPDHGTGPGVQSDSSSKEDRSREDEGAPHVTPSSRSSAPHGAPGAGSHGRGKGDEDSKNSTQEAGKEKEEGRGILIL